jgi:prepilin-type N-terminal cleavage/methylation domain-containing protein
MLGIRVFKAITGQSSVEERGLTFVELMVTLSVMGVITTAALAVFFRAFADTGIVENRRDVLGDGQIALEQMTKQLRQAESVDEINSSASTVTFSSYINGTPKDIVWRTTGGSSPYTLQVSTEGSAGPFRDVLSTLASNAVFTYTEHDGVLDQVTIDLRLGTKTATVAIATDVQLRNALR